jgi:hypothetical protein
MNEEKWIECPHCKNTGKEIPDCEECEGRGWVNDPLDDGTMTCPECDDETCSVCDGEKYILDKTEDKTD